ncbi:MAG: hypothetical protein LUC93_01865 [Planctomycetaceae bacterium]|nr:hypothetical protein [Planctomycetaceae bacterium]
MKMIHVALVLLGLGIFAGQAVAAEGPAQKMCPVSMQPLASVANPVRVQMQGFTFLVADEESRAKAMQSSPATVFSALAKNGDAAEPISQACPVMGNRINPDLFLQKNGYRIYMCCRGCTKRVQNNWDATLLKLRDQADGGDPQNLPTM